MPKIRFPRQRYPKIVAAFCLIVFAEAASTSKQILSVATYESPPYQNTQAGVLSGTSLIALRCVLDKLDRPYKITVFPQKRAFQSLRAGRVDALLSVTPEQLRHSDGFTLSEPIALEKWAIYSHLVRGNLVSDVGANYFGSLGVVLGSPQEEWLQQRSYPINNRVLDMPMLLNMFALHRFDSMLIDSFQLRSQDQQILMDAYGHFVKYSPKFVAFSGGFAQHNGDFIAVFNERVSHCQSMAMQLSDAERHLMVQQSQPLFAGIQQDHAVLTKVLSQNHNPPDSDSTIADLEAAWSRRSELSDEALRKLFEHVVSSDAAQQLMRIKGRSRGLVREIIITDQRGYNALVTDQTSDFYQGDEAKFSQVFGPSAESIYVSPIRYDASCARFLVHISMPLLANSDPVGVMVLGLDPEIALANRHLWGATNHPQPGVALDP